ncbi:MAG TPA: uroporphyrinogen decarboxylase family protein [Paludibaculum sp.]|jgi:uroporphyrinogen decarboxylase
MRVEQWQALKTVAKGGGYARTPVAAIVDSPWIPGYVGISHLEYFCNPEAWFQANLKVMRDFPEIAMLPGWWVEYGMAIEPSALGNRIHFQKDRPPEQSATLMRLADVSAMKPVDCETDGLMPFALHLYRAHKQRIFDEGYTIPMVAARGPLCLASFLRGVNQLMLDIHDEPEGVHELFRLTTQTVINWLKAQAAAIGDSVEGILVLDDIVGFLPRRLYLEFGHPYLKQICDAFPAGWVKIYHNDANARPMLGDLAETGFDVLNWSHKISVREAREKTGGRMCLLGNVPPLEVGVRGTPEMVRAAALDVLDQSEGRGLILSMGGGISMETPGENLRALAETARGWKLGIE